MTSKQTLLKALKEAKGPSRELDAMAEAVLRSKPNANSDHYIFRKFPKWGWRGDGRVEAGDIWWQAQRYTASLDACIALQKRVLPGCDYEVGSCGPHMVGARARVWDDLPETGDPWAVSCEHADDPALALCIAIVEALIAQEQETEHDYG
jgi:hypothetical protein